MADRGIRQAVDSVRAQGPAPPLHPSSSQPHPSSSNTPQSSSNRGPSSMPSTSGRSMHPSAASLPQHPSRVGGPASQRSSSAAPRHMVQGMPAWMQKAKQAGGQKPHDNQHMRAKRLCLTRQVVRLILLFVACVVTGPHLVCSLARTFAQQHADCDSRDKPVLLAKLTCTASTPQTQWHLQLMHSVQCQLRLHSAADLLLMCLHTVLVAVMLPSTLQFTLMPVMGQALPCCSSAERFLRVSPTSGKA